MEARFRKYVSQTPTETGCLLWTGYAQQQTQNYRRPYFSVATGKPAVASRVAYQLWKGDIPEGQVVRHTCDNPLCVNPDHLLLGTHQDNIRDKVERGRGRVPHNTIGERNPQSKLTEEQVREIRQSTQTAEFVRRFGVCRSTIQSIRRGDTWKFLLPPSQ